jgi:hypothetical protein
MYLLRIPFAVCNVFLTPLDLLRRQKLGFTSAGNSKGFH